MRFSRDGLVAGVGLLPNVIIVIRVCSFGDDLHRTSRVFNRTFGRQTLGSRIGGILYVVFRALDDIQRTGRRAQKVLLLVVIRAAPVQRVFLTTARLMVGNQVVEIIIFRTTLQGGKVLTLVTLPLPS